MSKLIVRHLEKRIRESLADTPVVLVNGPRQSGKTTLVQSFAEKGRRYLTLDDESTLLAAKADPTGFVQALDTAVIDEIQRAPAVLLAIKASVDRDRRPGRFLLTGSANLMMLPNVADSLAGRMETLSLYPFAGCEIHGTKGQWLDTIFNGKILRLQIEEERRGGGKKLIDTVLAGGYPEALSRSTVRRRSAWGRQYVDAIIQRDVREIASIDKLGHLSRLIKIVAAMSGQLANFTEIGAQIGLDTKTAMKYVAVLEWMFLVRRVEPWSTNRISRIVKTPKLHFLDSGLLAGLTGLTPSTVAKDRTRFGHTLESHVFGELTKLCGFSEGDYRISTYRDRDCVEVDFVVADDRDRVVGIEVKSTAGVSSSDRTGLRKLAALAEDKFVAGIILYDGKEILPLGEKIWAVPISTLWVS